MTGRDRTGSRETRYQARLYRTLGTVLATRGETKADPGHLSSCQRLAAKAPSIVGVNTIRRRECSLFYQSCFDPPFAFKPSLQPQVPTHSSQKLRYSSLALVLVGCSWGLSSQLPAEGGLQRLAALGRRSRGTRTIRHSSSGYSSFNLLFYSFPLACSAAGF